MKEITIFHASPVMNHFCEPDYSYKQIGTINADSINQAFLFSQNGIIPNNPYEALKQRSTCVGDIFLVNGKYHMVKSIGFKEIPQTFFRILEESTRKV
jgi:hypothetical protein